MRLTPVTAHAGTLVKREDLFALPGAPGVVGGKLRQVSHAAVGARGLVGHGGRRSNTAAALAAAGRVNGIPVRFHTAAGADTPEMKLAASLGAEIVRHRPGYLGTVRKRAVDDGDARGWRHVQPCASVIAAQVENLAGLPFTRLVLACGSGATLAGVLFGMQMWGLPQRVLAVVVGAEIDPDYLDARVSGWRAQVTFQEAGVSYETEVDACLGDLQLDPLYEAKAAKFLRPGDLLWNLGCRARSSTCTAPST